ncbi:hypothetical protein HN51_053536 [Arachis hypogaea]|uniref:F-box/kelch-repeat protein n=1 Tax=Arachis hypogaea TaxID=3818 RepID=A0A444XCG5_ARAHY|nr:F-box/kelch-repeat protein At3g23880-like [Arachis ipaensis]XP_025677891.1 F-box/kelch-repeat protein At3g23880-like [Arachis hypogaea]QHN75894.1 F-box/kelch-repeat protein [Arachis hypogaea]RYQ87408.1 hypothetical protein Ahy_B09g094923 [Arachis hypogaea]
MSLQIFELPDEIVEEILLRLPVSSLLPLRTVCRSWRTLISSSKFAHDHARRSILVDPTLTHPQIAYYGVDYKYRGIGIFSIRSVFESTFREPTQVARYEHQTQRYFRVIGSCNGLLCLVDETAPNTVNAILWNPCTGFTSEPTPEIGGFFVVCGFGYDRVSDSYKLFGMLTDLASYERRTVIYTFAPNSSWRTIQDVDLDLLGPIDVNNRDGEFVSSSNNNTLNWVGMNDVILSLDLGNETYSYFPLPERDPKDDVRVSVELSVLRNRLAVCFEHKRSDWAVWVMEEYGVTESWSRLALIPRQVVKPNDVRCLRPLYISDNDALLAITPSFRIVLCDLKEKHVLVPIIVDQFVDDYFDHYYLLSQCTYARCFYVYHESLVSPSHYAIASS